MLVPLLRIRLGQHRVLCSRSELVQGRSRTRLQARFQEFAMIARVDGHSPDCLLSFLQLTLPEKPVDGNKAGILGARIEPLVVRYARLDAGSEYAGFITVNRHTRSPHRASRSQVRAPSSPFPGTPRRRSETNNCPDRSPRLSHTHAQPPQVCPHTSEHSSR